MARRPQGKVRINQSHNTCEQQHSHLVNKYNKQNHYRRIGQRNMVFLHIIHLDWLTTAG